MRLSDFLIIFSSYYLFAGAFTGGDYGLELQVLDVGQGDAILVTTPNDKHVLIDGGPSFEVDYQLFKEFFPKTCELDIVVLTHPHADHVLGLNRVLKRCRVGAVFYNKVSHSSRTYYEWQELAEKAGAVGAKAAKKGDKFSLDGVDFYVLAPDQKILKSFSNLNNTSVVLFLDYKDFEALLTGDAESKILARLDIELIKRLTEGKLDVYKVPHQGAEDGLNKKFVRDIDPANAVISVGRNSYGHPHKSVLGFFEQQDINVFRTDINGNVVFKAL